jgi:predicted RNase H-related nuclease YkuK (DUF458 family)
MTAVKNKAKTPRKQKVRKAYMDKDPYTYDPFEKWVWQKYETNHVLDIDEFIETNKDCMFFIGSDSQNYPKSKKCVFTTVLIAYRMGKGGCIARHVDKRPMIPVEALSARLTVETQRSIEICRYLENKLLELSIRDDVSDDEMYTKNIVGISIDVNNDDRHKSGRYKDMLVGMVVAYGYDCFIKPDAWASSKVADNKC